MAYETYWSELVTCDDVVVELEDFSGVCNNCSVGFSTREVDIDVGLVWTGDEEGRIILCPCNAWINSSESSSVFVGDRSRTRVNEFDGTFSICVIADVWKKVKVKVFEIMNKVFFTESNANSWPDRCGISSVYVEKKEILCIKNWIFVCFTWIWILSDDWLTSSSNCFICWLKFSSEDFPSTRLVQVISDIEILLSGITSWSKFDWLLSDLSSTVKTVTELVRPLSEENSSWFNWYITELIVSLIKSRTVSIRIVFASGTISSVLFEIDSWVFAVGSDSDSVFSLSEIFN
jgi:hypothetical protein